VLGRLSNVKANRSSEIVDILKTAQLSEKLKCYKQFLYNVLCNSDPEFVLLYTVTLDKIVAVNMKHINRVDLISKIKINKDNIDINNSIVRSHDIRKFEVK